VPRSITHESRLASCEALLDEFQIDTAQLGSKLGPILVQLPPSLAFDHGTVTEFLRLLRARFAGPIALEPRHASWFAPEARELLLSQGIHRVAADPEPVSGVGAGNPDADRSLVYFRLHGSPRIYHSAYDKTQLIAVQRSIVSARATSAWCIFDNTASGAAIGDALSLLRSLNGYTDDSANRL
jgi:uncharacterized protein YecE (DUF72 family)